MSEERRGRKWFWLLLVVATAVGLIMAGLFGPKEERDRARQRTSTTVAKQSAEPDTTFVGPLPPVQETVPADSPNTVARATWPATSPPASLAKAAQDTPPALPAVRVRPQDPDQPPPIPVPEPVLMPVQKERVVKEPPPPPPRPVPEEIFCVPASVVDGFPEAFSGPAAWRVEGEWVYFEYHPRVEGVDLVVDDVALEAHGRREQVFLEEVERGRVWRGRITELATLGVANWVLYTDQGKRYSQWGRGTNKLFWLGQDAWPYIVLEPNLETFIDWTVPGGRDKLAVEWSEADVQGFILSERVCPYNVGPVRVNFAGGLGVGVVMEQSGLGQGWIRPRH